MSATRASQRSGFHAGPVLDTSELATRKGCEAMAITTVAGPVESDDLGMTLMHEHLFINLMPEYRATGLINNLALMVDEIAPFVAAGGRSIVDVTPAELTRGASPDPAGHFDNGPGSDSQWPSRTPANVVAVQELAKDAGVHVVLGTGHYRDPYLASGWLDEHSVDQITEQLMCDVEEGFSGTRVRAGIIGEIGADKWFISAREERSFRAAARAQRQTNLALTTHAARWPVGIPQLDLLAEEGVDPTRVIIGHCDSVAIPEYHEAIARRGAFVQYDLLRGDSDQQTQQGVSFVVNMIRKGFVDHLLLSHDVCTHSQLLAGGGGGFAFVPTKFADRLRAEGVSDDEIFRILVENPARALAGK